METGCNDVPKAVDFSEIQVGNMILISRRFRKLLPVYILKIYTSISNIREEPEWGEKIVSLALTAALT